MNIKSKQGLLSQPENTTGFIMHKDALTSAMTAGLQMVQEGETNNFLISRHNDEILLSIGENLDSLFTIHSEANASFKNFITEQLTGKLYSRYISDYYGENFANVNDFVELTSVEAAYILLRASKENPDDIRFAVYVNESEDFNDNAWEAVTLDDIDRINSENVKWMVAGETDVPTSYLIQFTDKLGDEDDYDTLLLNECKELIRFNPDIDFEFDEDESEEEIIADIIDEVVGDIVKETADVAGDDNVAATINKVIEETEEVIEEEEEFNENDEEVNY